MPPRPVTPKTDGLRQVPALRAARAARPHLAGQEAHEGAPLVLRRPPGRQPGPHRPHGPGAQAAHVRDPRRDGVQGDRGRLPVGVAARLRLRPPPHRGGPGPGRRDHPGADAVPSRADPADVRVPAGRAAGDRPLLQLHLDPAAARGVRPRQGRASSTSPSTRPSSAGSSRRRCPAPRSSTSTRPRATPAPRSSSPSRSARRSWTSSSRPRTARSS